MSAVAKCSRCQPGVPAVQIVEGHFKNGRRHTEGRCERHSVKGDEVGLRWLTASGAAFEMDHVRPIDAYETQLALNATALSDGIAVARLELAQQTVDHMVIRAASGLLYAWDAGQRIYLTRRRTSDNWHIVRALPADDASVKAGEHTEGSLSCCCPGGQYHGHCWAIDAVARYEADLEDERRWSLPEPDLQAVAS